MKDIKRLIRLPNAILFLFIFTLLLSVLFRINTGTGKGNESRNIGRTVSYNNHNERENSEHFNVVNQEDLYILLIESSVRLKSEKRIDFMPADFAEIDRMPKVRMQSARSKIPDIRTNVLLLY